MGHERIRGDRAEPPGLEVLERLLQLGSGVHHERPVGRDRLADGLAAQEKHLQCLTARVLAVARADLDPIAGPEHHQLAVGWAPVVPDPACAGENVDEGVEDGIPRQCSRAPGAMVAWTSVIGVCVDPGPRCPPSSPAITRTSAPPSGT